MDGILRTNAGSIIKDKVADSLQLNSDITWDRVLITIGIALVMGIIVYFIHKRTFTGVVFTKSFSLSLILLTLVTSVIVMTISSSLALGLGMVGALSIVRFRTAIKDPMDTMYMFWAIAEGILVGAGFYLPAAIACVVIAIIMLVLSLFKFSRNKPYVLVIRFDISAKADVQRMLDRFPEGKLKSKTVTKTMIEMTIEMNMTGKDIGLMEKFAEIPGVYDASVVSYSGDVVV
ncbi:MAG: DUF4956 domain-containing protein [Christensenellaceae bacterium]|nr:DUF4956 domain-containing protein [Christensenellaceae bacterium]